MGKSILRVADLESELELSDRFSDFDFENDIGSACFADESIVQFNQLKVLLFGPLYDAICTRIDVFDCFKDAFASEHICHRKSHILLTEKNSVKRFLKTL